jgi:predicted RNA polymerase sigma factor
LINIAHSVPDCTALYRAIAIAQHEGPERGLEEIRAIAGSDRLAAYPFYSAALGELELRSGRRGFGCLSPNASLAEGIPLGLDQGL